jgi:hypothetical protein
MNSLEIFEALVMVEVDEIGCCLVRVIIYRFSEELSQMLRQKTFGNEVTAAESRPIFQHTLHKLIILVYYFSVAPHGRATV